MSTVSVPHIRTVCHDWLAGNLLRVTPSAIRVLRRRSHEVRKEEQKAAGASDRRERIPQPRRQIGRPTRKRTCLSRLELIGGSGRTAGRYASAARAFISPTAFEQARGGALGEGGGRVGFAGGGLF